MIVTLNDYYKYKNLNYKKSIYSAFSACKGITNSKYYNLLLNKILGYNIYYFKKKLKNLTYIKDHILIFFFTIFLQKKLFWYEQQKKKMFFLRKYIPGYSKYIRYYLHLPVNGQRTHTNGKTAKKLNK